MKFKSIIGIVFIVIVLGAIFYPYHDPVEKMVHLHGKTANDVIEIFGKPTIERMLTLEQGTTLPEIYIEVHNTYHPDDPKVDGLLIKELNWDKDGYTVVLILHEKNGQWEVFESVRYVDGIAF